MIYDTFHRSNQSGWGTSTNRESWTTHQLTSNVPTLSISSNAGIITVTGETFMQLGTQTKENAECLTRVTFSSSETSEAVGGIVLRANSSNIFYALFIDYAPGYPAIGAQLVIQNFISGSVNDTLANSLASIDADTAYWVRARIVESDLILKVWQDGSSEPETPSLSVTDTTISGFGGVGLLAYGVGSSVKFDYFFVN